MGPSRKALQQSRPLSAAPGSSALNRPDPAREFKLQARVHRVHSGPARLLRTTRSSQGSTPRSRGRPARTGSSEAAAVKARWLGNFCPRQPVHRALKRQQQPRPLPAAPGSSALNRPGPAREFQVRSSGPPGLFRSGPPAQDNMPQPGLAPLPRFRERPASQDHQPRTGSTCNIHAPSPLRRVLRSSTGRPRTGV